MDWGTATVLLQGQPVRIIVFCKYSKASGKPFVRLYPCERQQTFFDALMRGFDFFGGIFPRLIFDNLTTAFLDQLTHRAHAIECTWDSYRLKQHLKGGKSGSSQSRKSV